MAKKTVFVAIVDPGVGTKRKSIAVKTEEGYYFILPNNGLLTFIAKKLKIKEIREINYDKYFLKKKGNESYTFHGRDLFAHVGALLASRKIKFSQIGNILNEPIYLINIDEPYIKNKTIYGHIISLDTQYGNIWTDISDQLCKHLKTNMLLNIVIKKIKK